MEEKLRAAKADVDKARKELQSLVLKNKEALASLRSFYAEAKKERGARDEENAKVQELKAKKSEAEEKAEKARVALERLEKELASLPGVQDPAALKEQIERLEWVQQTEATPFEEKALSKEINELRRKLPKAEAKAGTLAERAAVREELKKANAEAKKLREDLREHAKKSDLHHEAYVKALKKASSLQEKLAEAFKDLDAKRALLQGERKEFEQMRHEIREQERSEAGKERAEQAALMAKQKTKVSQHALLALERFKAGEKISLEDLQAIQEAGLA